MQLYTIEELGVEPGDTFYYHGEDRDFTEHGEEMWLNDDYVGQPGNWRHPEPLFSMFPVGQTSGQTSFGFAKFAKEKL